MPLTNTTRVPLTVEPVNVIGELTGVTAGDKLRLQNGGGAVIRHGEFTADPTAASPAHTLDTGDSIAYEVVGGRNLWAWSVQAAGSLIVSQER